MQSTTIKAEDMGIKVNEPWASENSSIACLFSFPFPVYVDTESKLSLSEQKIEDETVRIYPFFRSGPANFNSSPPIDLSQVPLPIGNHPTDTSVPRYLPWLTTIPSLSGEPTGSAILTIAPTWEKKPRFFPMDSIRIDILGSHPKPPGFANDVVNRLLRNIRVRTRQWWIGIEYPTGTEYYLRQIVPISRSGAFKGTPEGNGSFTTPRGDERPLDRTIWHEVITDVRTNRMIADYEDLLLDARYHAAKNEMRRSIIDLAVACEQACEATFIRIIEHRKLPLFRRGKYYSGNDLTKHLNHDLLRLSGFSLDSGIPETSKHISELWSLRGDLAHGRHQEVPKEKISTLIQAAEDCVRWLERLPAEPVK